jgi:protein arginine kinase activator
MLCQDCKKSEANVHFTQVVGNKKITLNLCRECAEKRGFHPPLENSPFPLKEFISGMIEEPRKKKELYPELACPQCQMGFADFSKRGKIGCGKCYETFRPQLRDLLRKIHGTSEHKGKTPQTRTEELIPLREERRLRGELKQAIQDENFESAAKIRDQIKGLLKGR